MIAQVLGAFLWNQPKGRPKELGVGKAGMCLALSRNKTGTCMFLYLPKLETEEEGQARACPSQNPLCVREREP